jgi:hypothetical protein
MQAMNTAQQAKDTAVINNLMKGYSEFKQKLVLLKTKYTTYAESHPKSYISVLIVQGMVNDLVQTLKNRNNFNGLDESLKALKLESVKTKLTEINSPAVGATAAPVGDINELQICCS